GRGRCAPGACGRARRSTRERPARLEQQPPYCGRNRRAPACRHHGRDRVERYDGRRLQLADARVPVLLAGRIGDDRVTSGGGDQSMSDGRVALDVTVAKLGRAGPHVYVTEVASALQRLLGDRLCLIAKIGRASCRETEETGVG